MRYFEDGKQITLRKGKNLEMGLVEKLCSPAQIKSYKERKRFKSGADKNRFIENLKRFCEYVYDPELKTYTITNLLSVQVPKRFGKMNDGASKYLIPLILKSLLENRDVNNAIEIPIDKYLTSVKWAERVNMINENFSMVRNNKTAISDIFALNTESTIDFINRITNCINYYIQQALENLRKFAIIKYYREPIICVETFDGFFVKGKTVNASKYKIKRRATHDEIEFINQCETKADKAAGIQHIIIDRKTKSERSGVFQRYFGPKSVKYKEVLKKELGKRNILYTYDAYAVFMVDEERCLDFLKMFGVSDFGNLESDFNNFLKELVLKNCDKRFEKFIETYQDDVKAVLEKQMSHQKETSDFALLSDITIMKDANPVHAEVLKYRKKNGIKSIEGNMDDEDYDVKIEYKGERIYDEL